MKCFITVPIIPATMQHGFLGVGTLRSHKRFVFCPVEDPQAHRIFLMVVHSAANELEKGRDANVVTNGKCSENAYYT